MSQHGLVPPARRKPAVARHRNPAKNRGSNLWAASGVKMDWKDETRSSGGEDRRVEGAR